MTQSALSQIIRNLEERIGVRLLNRTTRSVTPTQAGERLFLSIGPKFGDMDAELAALSALREKPAGIVRFTATEYAATEILLPALGNVLPKYPDIHVEVIIDYGLTNIVAQQVDAGIRPGELVAKDMIAVRVSPDLRMAVVGSPSYFAERKRPKSPQDLTRHSCLNLRLPTHGGSLYAWEFEKNGRELNVRVEGQLVFNSAGLLLEGALRGFGLAYLTEGHAQPYVSKGQLVRVLSDWCPPFSGYHLYYPSRRQPSPAFSIMVEALRHRGK
jgi:DNA-binding transcriptional LysR family regulator